MNKQLFNKILFTDGKIEESQVADLEKLASTFPYSPIVRQLYLKALLDTEDYRFENQLKKTAITVLSRKQLKTFLFGNPRHLEANSEKNNTVAKSDLPQEDENNKSSHLEIVKEVPTPSNTKNSDTAPQQPTGLENDYLAHAIDASISIEVDHKEIASDKPTVSDTDLKIIAKQADSFIPDQSTKQSFSDWIKGYQQDKEEKQTKKENFRKNAEALIDQFISAQPKIVPQREFYSAVNMAKKSIEEPDDLASETLAKIYIEQGKTQKAIKIYEVLITKNPEKKIYFASRINQLRNSK